MMLSQTPSALHDEERLAQTLLLLGSQSIHVADKVFAPRVRREGPVHHISRTSWMMHLFGQHDGLLNQPARCPRVRGALAGHTCPCRTLPFSDCRAISAARGSKYCTNP